MRERRTGKGGLSYNPMGTRAELTLDLERQEQRYRRQSMRKGVMGGHSYCANDGVEGGETGIRKQDITWRGIKEWASKIV